MWAGFAPLALQRHHVRNCCGGGTLSWCVDKAMWAGVAPPLFMDCARVFIAEGHLGVSSWLSAMNGGGAS